ncbi:MAG: NADPH:quinone oxidoreductase family protein [Sandaracinobacter sp.]
MKAIAANRLDGFDAYGFVEVPVPTLGEFALRIEVHAVGIGYVDALIARGGYQVKPSLPHIPGVEVAGTISAVGSAVKGWVVGDRAVAMTSAGLAEQAVAPADACRRIPPGVGFAEAAALPLNHLTALHGLVDRGRLQPGETLLVFGAAGGVGQAAVAVGKRLGATVIAAASSQLKRDFAVALGADEVIDTDPEGWRDRLRAALGGRPLDVVFDPVAGPLFQPAFRSLGWGGRHLIVGFVGGPIPALPANLPLMKGAALVGVDVRQFQQFEPQAAAAYLDRLFAWLADGSLPAPNVQLRSWADASAALAEADSGQTIGKLVIVSDPSL